MGDPHAGMGIPRPSISWGEVPAGWTQGESSGLRAATFILSDNEGRTADLAIIPMGGFAGTDGQLVNMWRTQLGLPEVSDAEAGLAGARVNIGGLDGRQYAMAGIVNGTPVRMIVSSATRDNVNYFFKLTGDDALVLAHQENFARFLEGIEFGGVQPAVAAAGYGAAPAAEGQRWSVPPGWNAQTAGQFLLARYEVRGGDGAAAEVTVSQLGGAAGGMLPNVNRWRGQLNLGPISQAELDKYITPIKAGQADASLIRMDGTELQKGTAARMLVAVVPQPGETWFFKMTGPVSLVETREAEFLAMVTSARF